MDMTINGIKEELPEDIDFDNPAALLVQKLNLEIIQGTHTSCSTYECVTCDVKFINEDELTIHKMIHSDDHNCFVCKQFVKNRFQFVGHVRKHMSAKPFLCPELNCDKAFANVRETKLHQRVHSNERPFMCTECGKAFKNINTLREHEIVHTGVKRFKCKICGGSFATNASHRRHIRVMHEAVRSFQCNYCRAAFTSRQALDQHKIIHRDIDPLKCQLCHEKLPDNDKFEEHKKMHIELKESGTCEYCGTKTFYFGLKEHMEKKHKPRHCDICSLVFYDDKSFENHKKSHLETQKKEDLVCNICGKQFDFLRYLKAHLKRHQEDYRKFKCELCDKAFSSKRDLHDHIMVHSDIKNYKCDICGKAFRTKQSVNKHKPIHSDKRPYECKMCPKSFKKQSILRKHLLTHSKVRPYVCHCGKSFKSNDSLRVHKYSHSKWRHKCKECKKKFRFITSMKGHGCKSFVTGYLRPGLCVVCKRYVRRPLTLACHKLNHFKGKTFHCDTCKADFKYKYSLRLHEIKHKLEVKLEEDVKEEVKEETDREPLTAPINFVEVKIEC